MSAVMTTGTLASAEAVLELLREWEEAGWLRSVDRALVRFLHEQAPAASPLALLLAALASHQVGRGHVCLELDALLQAPDATLALPPEGEPGSKPPPRPSSVLQGVSVAQVAAALQDSGLAGPGELGGTPLVYTGGQVYLRRYWESERRIGQAIRARLADREAWQGALDEQASRDWLDHLFGPPAEAATDPDWQRLACALAAGSGFSVITGGPGTGKTTTVLRLLALLQGLQGPDDPLRIRLAAPTGKAAARLNASVSGALDRLGLDQLPDGDALRRNLPAEVVTVHRLLGARPDTRHFRHGARNPLAVDVLVVDEASMIDLELMASLVEAVPRTARLILLGDRDQLASVEAGAVLGELCHRAGGGHYTPSTAHWLEAVTGMAVPAAMQDAAGQALDQHIVMLRESHRFGADSGIGRLAAAVNTGEALNGPDGDDAVRQKVLAGPEDPVLVTLAVDGRADTPEGEAVGYAGYLEGLRAARPAPAAPRAAWEDWARDVLAAHGRFQLLCAVRRGPWGLETLNRRVAAALQARGLLAGDAGRMDGPGAGGQWVEGRPVIVTRNDYALGLINGDIGIALAVPAWLARGEPEADSDATKGEDSVLRVAFLAAGDGGRVRWVLPNRLEAIETAFALTVHKAQGSEFEHVALVLPDADSPILTRELAYTAITRASRWFSLLEPRAGTLVAASQHQIRRSGGLRRWLGDAS
ncbi:exodeoxyribonuclease V subunit alpha [Thioalkalivibrio versutus]|uniref:RecBCD enzyme subunit RecD n=1 Tax=Thioalkalivibrio versutus TaxID=106634 RepID=A0A0G3G0U0_9GAMM|nr:exodeoxyribonuclease V subunit alpha [Thioalkalivibrio versutus]AKJ94815.1 exodeoxyribonuclease V subunit alpha [Thioalkalivibrio versutus]